MKQVNYLITTFFVLTSFTLLASSDICLDEGLLQQPIQANGRVVPLPVYAKTVTKLLVVSKNCSKLAPVSLYCYLSLGQREAIEENSKCTFSLKVKHPELIKFFDVKNKTVSLAVFDSKREQLVTIYRKFAAKKLEKEGYPRAINQLLNKRMKIKEIEEGRDWKYLDDSGKWLAAGTIQKDKLTETLLSSIGKVTPLEVRNLNLETIYHKINPYLLSMIICMLGFIFSVLSFKSKIFNHLTTVSLITVCSLELIGTVLRTFISGRAPITNMYETVMLTGWAALLLSAYLKVKLDEKKVLPIGFAVNLGCLFMMKFSGNMLDESIRPLVPVLKDNFWLSTHVTAVTLSYASFSLSWFVANFILISSLFVGNRIDDKANNWNQIIRISVQVGVVFLALGIILGGIWADYSWGRFWGWDPKETWSLITLVVYLIILHGKYVGWFKHIYFSFVAAVGFLFVLMTWFGVNYILSSGLHSYGFSSGGATFLIAIFAAQVVVLALGLAFNKRVTA